MAHRKLWHRSQGCCSCSSPPAAGNRRNRCRPSPSRAIPAWRRPKRRCPASRTANPADAAVDLTSVDALRLTFSEPIYVDSVEGALSVRAGDALVAGVIDWSLDVNAKVARFTPNAPYGDGTTVQWTLDVSAREASSGRLAGKSLDHAVNGFFLTRLVARE